MSSDTFSLEQYGEFKGNTSAKLEIIFNMMRDQRIDTAALKTDVQSLKDTRVWSMGWLSGVGLVTGIIGAFVKERFLKNI